MLNEGLEKELYLDDESGMLQDVGFNALPEVAALLDRMLLGDELGLKYSRVVALLLVIDVSVFALGYLLFPRVEQTQVAS